MKPPDADRWSKKYLSRLTNHCEDFIRDLMREHEEDEDFPGAEVLDRASTYALLFGTHLVAWAISRYSRASARRDLRESLDAKLDVLLKMYEEDLVKRGLKDKEEGEG